MGFNGNDHRHANMCVAREGGGWWWWWWGGGCVCVCVPNGQDWWNSNSKSKTSTIAPNN